MTNRTTPDLITELAPNEVFVFGSNLMGKHGAGAAKAALRWGAKYGQGQGLQGRAYGLPTKGYDLRRPLSLPDIAAYIRAFIFVAIDTPHLTFLVTRVGMGLAGYSLYDIAPLFIPAIPIENIHLPADFWEYYAYKYFTAQPQS